MEQRVRGIEAVEIVECKTEFCIKFTEDSSKLCCVCFARRIRKKRDLKTRKIALRLVERR